MVSLDATMHAPVCVIHLTYLLTRCQCTAGRFDQVPFRGALSEGVTHFQDMAPTFSNSLDTQNALGNKPRTLQLAKEMTSEYRTQGLVAKR